MSFIFNNAQVRISTSTSAVIGTTTTSTAVAANTEGAGMIDISDQVTRVRLQREFEEHDDTPMGNTARSRVPGLETWAFELDVLQGFTDPLSEAFAGASTFEGVDDLLNSILDANALVYGAVRTCNDARSTANPEYYGLCRLFTHTVYDGEVGDLLKTNPQFRSAGNLTRAVCSTA